MTINAIRLSDRNVTREQVLAWENRRFDKAARKLGVTAPQGATVASRREAWLATKLDLGPEAIMERLSRDTRWADQLGRVQARVSPSRRTSIVEIDVAAGTAAEFVEFFEAASTSSDEAPMLRACPDHFVIRDSPQGQQVLETTGGSPLAALFTIDYDDVSSLVTAPDPAYPLQLAGVARASDGTAIGGVRHQFRDTSIGFRARLTVEFPLPTMPTMVSGHRWHLACEFSNWIEAALQS